MTRWLALVAVLAAGPALAEPGVVQVTITGVQSAEGHVLVALCGREQFTKPDCPYRGIAPARVGTVVVQITGVPPGLYAAQAYHDANDNKKLDRTLLGFPEEGLGFSNNAPMRFGPPDFKDAAFTLGPSGAQIEFALRYF